MLVGRARIRWLKGGRINPFLKKTTGTKRLTRRMTGPKMKLDQKTKIGRLPKKVRFITRVVTLDGVSPDSTREDFTKQYNRLRQHAAVYNRTARPEVTSKQKGTAVLSLPPVNKPRKVPTSTTPAATPAAPAQSASSKLSITTDQLALLQKYNSRLANLSEPYNALGMGAGVNRKGPSAVANRKDKADRATTEQVLDPRTRLILYKMIGRGVIFEVNGCISTGKEVRWYHSLGQRCQS